MQYPRIYSPSILSQSFGMLSEKSSDENFASSTSFIPNMMSAGALPRHL